MGIRVIGSHVGEGLECSQEMVNVPLRMRLQNICQPIDQASERARLCAEQLHCGQRSLTYHNVHLVKCRTAAAAGSFGFAGLCPAAALPF